ncbi:hypothetical protein EYW49_04160 [Siculibacillus lacustris]|uniref:DUF883 family protein n=1 Tax=Siculibacillus lacustris TaxID=1549641 RepID=A0A4V2KU86_9HYPH|nr:hypothetical protein [Siculibacillus lacustris]TBW40385.1 hypothetical protein EYW49_04160 [Siculibacillus lacustris]
MAKADDHHDTSSPKGEHPTDLPIVADTDEPAVESSAERSVRRAEASAANAINGRIASMARPERLDTSRLQSDTAAVGDDVAALARQAVEAIRQAADAFAAQAGVKSDEAVAAARAAGTATIDGIGAVAGDARALTENGIDAIGRSVARNPVAALAIAAGAGLLLGWMTRSDARR